MQGLSEKALKFLEDNIKSRFDVISLQFLGIIPQKISNKNIVFKTSKDSLISIFLQSLGNKNPNKLEEQTLKTMLSVANNYLNGVRDRTTAKLINDIDGYVKDQRNKNKPVSINQMGKIINKEMDKAGNYLKLLANTESNKAKNTGTALQIAKIADEKNEEDPTVFFIVTHDDVTGFYEYVLHTLPDKITPRVWKLSEISSSYYNPGDQYPSLSGLHVNCRCHLSYLSKGWGFGEDGKIKYIGPNYDEFQVQRDKYGLPTVPERPKRKNNKWVYNT